MLRCRDIHRTYYRSAAGGAALIDICNTDERDIINNEDILNRVRVHQPNFIDILNNYAQNLMDNIQNERYLPRYLEIGRRNMQRLINETANENIDDEDGVNDDDYNDNDNDNDNDNGNDEEDNNDDEDEEEDDDDDDEEEDEEEDKEEDDDDDEEEEEEEEEEVDDDGDNKNQRKELLKAFSIESCNLYEKVNNIMLPWMRSEDPSVRMKICEMISMLVQNPYCLKKYMENTDRLKELMSMVENDNNDEVRVKALVAITNLARQNVHVFWQFIELGGKDLIFNSLKSPIDELKIKAVLLICLTCHLSDAIMALYLENEVIEIVSSIIMDMENNVESLHHELFSSLVKQMNRAIPGSGEDICYWMTSFNELFTPKYQDEKDQILRHISFHLFYSIIRVTTCTLDDDD